MVSADAALTGQPTQLYALASVRLNGSLPNVAWLWPAVFLDMLFPVTQGIWLLVLLWMTLRRVQVRDLAQFGQSVILRLDLLGLLCLRGLDLARRLHLGRIAPQQVGIAQRHDIDLRSRSRVCAGSSLHRRIASRSSRPSNDFALMG